MSSPKQLHQARTAFKTLAALCLIYFLLFESHPVEHDEIHGEFHSHYSDGMDEVLVIYQNATYKQIIDDRRVSEGYWGESEYKDGRIAFTNYAIQPYDTRFSEYRRRESPESSLIVEAVTSYLGTDIRLIDIEGHTLYRKEGWWLW